MRLEDGPSSCKTTRTTSKYEGKLRGSEVVENLFTVKFTIFIVHAYSLSYFIEVELQGGFGATDVLAERSRPGSPSAPI